MASLGHIAVGLAAGRYAGAGESSRWRIALLLALPCFALLPDLDVVSFKLGIPYAAPLGHRGASHSIVAALALGVLGGLALRRPGRSAWRSILLVTCVVASHGLLDTLTDGGLGVALLWPLSNQRYFAPLRPIPVAPIGLRLFSAWGLRVLAFELAVFLPFLLYACWPGRHTSDRAKVAPPGRRLGS